MVVGALRQATLLFVTLLVTMIYLLSSWLKVGHCNSQSRGRCQ